MFFDVCAFLFIGAVACLCGGRINEPFPKGFLCTIATCLGLGTMIMHSGDLVSGRINTTSQITDATNSFTKVFICVDTANMLSRRLLGWDSIVRKDLLIHHAVVLTYYWFARGQLGSAFVTVAEIISVWPFLCPRISAKKSAMLRMLSIYPVRVLVWISCLRIANHSSSHSPYPLERIDRVFFYAGPCVGICLDVYWFKKCYSQYRRS